MIYYKEYRIRRYDDLNLILEKEEVKVKGDNAGEKFWKRQGYYSTLQGALKGLTKRVTFDVVGEVPVHLRDLLELLESTLGELKEFAKGIDLPPLPKKERNKDE